MCKLKKLDFILIISILLLALFLRLPHLDNSLYVDEAGTLRAANLGFVANYWDTNSLSLKELPKAYLSGDLPADYHPELDAPKLRGEHPPLLHQLAHVDTFFLGFSEMKFRLISLFFGLATIALLYFASLKLFNKNARVIGFFSAFLLAILPLHIYASKTVKQPVVFAFFATACLLVFFYSLKNKSSKALYLSAILLGLSFLTYEMAIFLLPVMLLGFIFIKNKYLNFSFKGISWSKEFFYSLLLTLFTILIIWPAGILKLHILRSFLNAGARAILVKAPVYFASNPFESYYIAPLLPFACLIFVYLICRAIKPTLIKASILLLFSAGLLLFFLPQYTLIYPGETGFKEAADYLQENSSPDDLIVSRYGVILNVYLPEYKIIDTLGIANGNSQGAQEHATRVLDMPLQGWGSAIEKMQEKGNPNFVSREEYLANLDKYDYFVFYTDGSEASSCPKNACILDADQTFRAEESYDYAKENCQLVFESPVYEPIIYSPGKQEMAQTIIYNCTEFTLLSAPQDF